MSEEQKQPMATPPDADPKAGYEKKDASVRGIVLGMIVGVIVVIIAIVAVREFYIQTREEIVQQNVRERVDPRIRELNSEETRILTSYGKVEGQPGVVRIPIERAMELMVEEAYRERNR
jgi:hypothetical protein